MRTMLFVVLRLKKVSSLMRSVAIRFSAASAPPASSSYCRSRSCRCNASRAKTSSRTPASGSGRLSSVLNRARGSGSFLAGKPKASSTDTIGPAMSSPPPSNPPPLARITSPRTRAAPLRPSTRIGSCALTSACLRCMFARAIASASPSVSLMPRCAISRAIMRSLNLCMSSPSYAPSLNASLSSVMPRIATNGLTRLSRNVCSCSAPSGVCAVAMPWSISSMLQPPTWPPVREGNRPLDSRSLSNVS